jgi:hypothetical protein
MKKLLGKLLLSPKEEKPQHQQTQLQTPSPIVVRSPPPPSKKELNTMKQKKMEEINQARIKECTIELPSQRDKLVDLEYTCNSNYLKSFYNLIFSGDEVAICCSSPRNSIRYSKKDCFYDFGLKSAAF